MARRKTHNPLNVLINNRLAGRLEKQSDIQLVEANAGRNFFDIARDRPAALSPSYSVVLTFIFQCGDPFRADCVNHATEFFDLLTQPCKFFLADPVMLRVARLYIGFLELFKPCTICPQFAGPAVNQAHIKTLGLRS